MTIQWDIINQVYAAAKDHFGLLLTDLIPALVARGWVVKGSGDGLVAFQNEGQTAGPYYVFTNPPAHSVTGTWSVGGPNSWTNARAWVRIKEPGLSTRELLIQRSSTTTSSGFNSINFAMSVTPLSAGASASTVPTGNLQIKSFATAMNSSATAFGDGAASVATSPAWVVHVGISDTAKAKNVWPFFIRTFRQDTHAPLLIFNWESLRSEHASDDHPMWAHAQPGSSYNVTQYISSANNMTMWNDTTLGLSYGALQLLAGASGTAPNQVSQNVTVLIGGLRKAADIYAAYPNLAKWITKGVCDHLKWNPTTRGWQDTLNLASSEPYAFDGPFLLPWKTGIVPVS